ncbi:MAG: bifunctional nuclease family protein [Chitinispirillaceae bacterium]|nr:bifunctional nuclease family protein [Chitinispirillaceae bacterium]
MLVRVEISSFAIEATTNTPALVLKEYNGKRIFVIPIGPLEASAIAIESMNTVPEQPLTIDLVKIVLEQLGGRIYRVVISEKKKRSYEAKIYIRKKKKVIVISCRVVDAIALAIRSKVEILIDETLLRSDDDELSAKEKIRKHLRSLDTLDFGKYFLE